MTLVEVIRFNKYSFHFILKKSLMRENFMIRKALQKSLAFWNRFLTRINLPRKISENFIQSDLQILGQVVGKINFFSNSFMLDLVCIKELICEDWNGNDWNSEMDCFSE